jgi:primosomal protein N' (replication factor Y) (superfamily II helicase)
VARRAARQAAVPADDLPIARVAVDVSLAHLDRPFDYLVPQRLAAAAVPGCRVRVRFAGQLTGGYLLARAAASEHPGRLAYLERVVSPEPVLRPEIAALAREVADRYAGTLADVLRLAIPPRHAAAEAAPGSAAPGRTAPASAAPGSAALDGGALDGAALDGAALDGAAPDSAAPDSAAPGGGGPGGGGGRPPVLVPGPWARYPAGPAFLTALTDGRAPRAVWTALPGPDWPAEIALAAAATAASGRGTLIVLPDARDLGRTDQALAGLLGPGGHVCLAAGLGPAERYRRWLTVSRGQVRVVAGTRAAMFAPVHDLGLVVIWDDGDDLHAEPRAPYPHAREVLALRAHRAGAAALIGGFARTAEATSLVSSGWAAAVAAARPQVRACAPQVRAAGADTELARDTAARSARIPGLALRTARAGLARGPVLVQVPRRGYVTAVACENCRASARCAVCGGPLALATGTGPAACRWCGRSDPDWRCPACGDPRVRAVVTGSGRTAEELSRAFPGTPVVVSGGATVLTVVPAAPALVVATPGAEPRAEEGYAAAVLLDGWVMLGRPSLRAAEEALRRWLNAAALVRPGPAGGEVIVVAEASLPVVQALIRWDPVTHAERELAERQALRFPPTVRLAAVSGAEQAVAALMAAAELPPGADVLGPVTPDGAAPAGNGAGQRPADTVRMLVRVPRSRAAALAAALQAAQAVRSARKDAGPVRVQLDPAELI